MTMSMDASLGRAGVCQPGGLPRALCQRDQHPVSNVNDKETTMALKHLIATAAVAGALVAAGTLGAVSAQATPLPVPPRPINLPIYTQPSYPGFHLPSNLWQKPGPVLKPSIPTEFIPLHVLPSSCAQVFPTGSPQAGDALSADHSVRSATDSNLVALLNAQPSLNCNWTNSVTGAQVEVSIALVSGSLVAPLQAYFSGQDYIGAGVGPGYVSWVKGTNPIESDAVSTNDYWVVVRTNDSHDADYESSIIQNLWALNGISYE
jgi:hypothetical protein